MRIFLIPLCVTFLNTKILRFRFSVYFVLRNKMERSEMERNEMTVKIKLRKIVANLEDRFRELYIRWVPLHSVEMRSRIQ